MGRVMSCPLKIVCSRSMNIHKLRGALKLLAVLLAMGCYAPLAFADKASVSINSPVNGAKLEQKVRCRVYYELTLGSKGDHAYLYLDDKRVAMLRRLRDSHILDPLALGNHEICIKIVSRGHTPTGVQQCNKISVENHVMEFKETPAAAHVH